MASFLSTIYFQSLEYDWYVFVLAAQSHSFLHRYVISDGGEFFTFMQPFFFFQFKQRSSLGRECRAPLSWDLLTFLSPPPWWGPFDLSPLWSCVTRLCSGPCETHHAIGYCADWSQNLSGGVIAPLAGARSVSHSSTRGVAPKTAAQWGFWHMIRIHHECESVSYGAREIWEASSIFSNLRCSVGFVICLFSTKLDCNKV